jgi:hypothetical protein
MLLEHFVAAFPQKYNKKLLHFRFRREDPQAGYVWLDIRNPKDPLPAYKGIVMSKVLSLGELNVNKRKSRLRRKSNADPGLEGAKANARYTQSQAQPRYSDRVDQEVHENEEEEYEEEQPAQQQYQPPPPAPAATKPKSVSPVTPAAPVSNNRPPSASLLDDDEPAAAAAKPTVAAEMLQADDMINFGDSPRAGHKSKAGFGTGGTSSSSKSNSAGVDIDEKSAPSSFGTNGLTREELVNKREAEIAAKVAAAKEFKDDCDEKARNIAEEVEAAKARHDKNLDVWAANNKEKRNVRTLLTTMHTVLWPDSGWKPIGLGDVIEPSKVRDLIWLVNLVDVAIDESSKYDRLSYSIARPCLSFTRTNVPTSLRRFSLLLNVFSKELTKHTPYSWKRKVECNARTVL